MTGDDVQCVNKMVYLGHIIANYDRSDTLVDPVRRDFNVKLNSFIADFETI